MLLATLWGPIYNAQTQTFEPKTGPVFSQFVLADEINRAPAKVQSALLEAMQEKQVTIGNQTHPLPHPFLYWQRKTQSIKMYLSCQKHRWIDSF